MAKKILLIVCAIIVLLVGTLLAAPFLFKDQIKAKITAAINEKVEATISFEDADLSLLKSFPKASVSIQKLLIINKAPFAGDTLVSLGELNLKMSVMELFKEKNESINIEGLSTKNSLINIIFNEQGIGNFDIALKDKQPAAEEKSDPISLKIEKYEIENMSFRYIDKKSKIKMTIDSLNHSGIGNFASEKLDLETKSTAKIALTMDKISYLKNVPIALDAMLGIDLVNSKYTFKENKALINQLALELDGFIQIVPNGQEYDLKFKTPTASFKNFLGLIPAAFSSSLDNVKTSGDFTVVGFAKGLYSDTSVPKFNINIASHNASFQYPDLPKAVRNIVIDTKIINETGVLNDTYVNLDKLSFAIDQDIFNAKANIRNITQNALVNAALKGTINLGNLSKAYPIKLDKPLTGILNADMTTKFDMQSVEKSQYQNINNAGIISLKGFKYADDKGKTMTISNALVQFNPHTVNLKQFNATTGKSDLNISGVLNNFYGFLFRNQELQGNFDMTSNQIAVSDFMTTDEKSAETTSTAKAEPMKIPSFLNCTINAKANTVLYDNLTLKTVSGRMTIKDQKVSLQNIKTSIFDGTIGANGSISTKEKIPAFDMDLNLNKVDIPQAFTQLEMLKKIAPIAGVISGKMTSNIKLHGVLDPVELTPDLNKLSGELNGQLLSTGINVKNSTLLTALTSNLKFIDINKLNLKDVKASLKFNDGKVSVKPFNINYNDVQATIGGTHGFDQNMNYNMKFDVPAKYLGNEANALLAKLAPTETAKLENLPVTALVTGSFSNPKVSTDMKAAITNLTKQVVQHQKQKLIAKGTEKLNDVINKAIKKPGDSSKTAIPVNKEEVKAKASELLNGLFKKRK